MSEKETKSKREKALDESKQKVPYEKIHDQSEERHRFLLLLDEPKKQATRKAKHKNKMKAKKIASRSRRPANALKENQNFQSTKEVARESMEQSALIRDQAVALLAELSPVIAKLQQFEQMLRDCAHGNPTNNRPSDEEAKDVESKAGAERIVDCLDDGPDEQSDLGHAPEPIASSSSPLQPVASLAPLAGGEAQVQKAQLLLAKMLSALPPGTQRMLEQANAELADNTQTVTQARPLRPINGAMPWFPPPSDSL